MGQRKMFLLIGVMLLLVGLALPAFAISDDVRVYVDNAEVLFLDQRPLINKDNRTLVPIRFVSKALGGEVEWLGDTKTVEIRHEGEIILLKVGENFAQRGSEKIALDTTATIIGNRVMVPLRFVSECLGAYVYWNGAKRQVFITKNYLQQHKLEGI